MYFMEIFFKLAFKCKVECLGWKISYDVDDVSSPKGKKTLFLVDPGKTVNHTLVFLISSNALVSILNLKKHYVIFIS